jgi:hypothetical protein
MKTFVSYVTVTQIKVNPLCSKSMNSLQVIQNCRNRRNKAFKDTKAIKRRKKGSSKQINEEDGIDHVINEDDDRNLHNFTTM